METAPIASYKKGRGRQIVMVLLRLAGITVIGQVKAAKRATGRVYWETAS